MQLTSAEQTALSQGHPVPIVLGGTECIVVRKDIFDKTQQLVAGELDPRELYPMIISVLAEEEDPGLEAYQEFKRQS
jgi:hypothetical protein